MEANILVFIYMLFVLCTRYEISIASYSSSLDGDSKWYHCGGTRVYPSRNLLMPNGYPQPYAKCCNNIPFDDRAQDCCSDGFQPKTKGLKSCCVNTTKGVCNDELGCWGSGADCAIQTAAMAIPVVGAVYGAATAISSATTDKSIGQWLIESAFFDGSSESNRQTAQTNFKNFAVGQGLRANTSLSNTWKQRVTTGADKFSNLLEVAQAAKKIAEAKSIGEGVETVVKSFITLLETEKSKIGQLLMDKSSTAMDMMNSNIGQGVRKALRKVPAACLAIAAYDCAAVYGLNGRTKRSQVRQLISVLNEEKRVANAQYVIADIALSILLLDVANQELNKNPFLATQSLIDAPYHAELDDSETVADTLLNESATFFDALKRYVDPSSIRGARLSSEERQGLLASSKNRTMAASAIAFLANTIDEFINSSGRNGAIALFQQRLRNLDRQVSGVALDNMQQNLRRFNNSLVDLKFGVIVTQAEGGKIYAARPMVPNDKPFFTTFLPLPAGYAVESAVRVSQSYPKTLVSFYKFPEGIAFSDVFDHSDLTYFFKIKQALN